MGKVGDQESIDEGNILKGEPIIINNKEVEMVLFPFKKEKTQRLWSVIFIIAGILMIITRPITMVIENIGLNSFLTGVILSFLGFFYLIEAQ